MDIELTTFLPYLDIREVVERFFCLCLFAVYIMGLQMLEIALRVSVSEFSSERPVLEKWEYEGVLESN